MTNQSKATLIDRIKVKLNRIWRLNSAGLRKNPEFIIAGAQKCGTSSLFAYLDQHPQVALSTVKELHFFDDWYFKGLNHYRSFFPLKWSSRISGEASPYYLFHPCAPIRIHKHLPTVKIIVMLRDPIKRAFSHYNHMLRRPEVEELDFMEALKAEESRLKGERAKLLNGEIQWSRAHTRYGYIGRSKYHEQIKYWLEYFSMDQMLFIRSENFFSDPASELKRVYDFLGLEHVVPSDLKPRNTGKYKSEIPEDARAFLKETLKDDMTKLTYLIGPLFQWNQNT